MTRTHRRARNPRAGRLLAVLSVLALLLPLVAGCGPAASSGASAGDATPTPLPTPIIPEKAAYTVETGMVVLTLEFMGRASPLLEQ